jgi:hypothetical protein
MLSKDGRVRFAFIKMTFKYCNNISISKYIIFIPFNYFGCHVSYEGDKDIQDKITKFLKILGLLNNVLKPNQVLKTTKLKVYNTLAVPALIYGSEIWTLRKQDKTRLTTSEMKLLRKTAGYILMDHKKNEEII